ncbi:ABC-F family ATP-binding cassette domain-containing protein [Poseidonocella sp. HB161398]|uniref:ABC-F family ATP-binding cassette domain-containing protein n=1 Tax=Poseidonocella sp. HB161398 TaxID=2320855 RepID=UPI001108314E|nr:ABC-F family ATP-binding cassette domain-containing protein [Poseidonocella sp. HB161398]
MPAPVSVSISRLFWSVPDGRPLFTGLDLAFGPGRTGLVGRNGAGKSTLLRLIAGELSPLSGQIRTAGRLAMMRQEAAPAPGARIADAFGQGDALDRLERAAAGTASAADLAAADWDLPARIGAALRRCGLDMPPETPLAQLSGGEQSRAALAAAIFGDPDILLLDEPTDALDRDGRAAVAGLLRGWPGCAIVASHDRALLEEMDAIVELGPRGAARFGGGFSAYRRQKDEAEAAARQALDQAGRARDLARRRAQEAAERKARKDGAGKRSRAKGGQPKVLLDAAKERAEASGGAGTRLREARCGAAEAALEEARARVERLLPVDMEIAPTGLAPARRVLRLDGVAAGHDPAAPVLRGLSLEITGPERVVIAGPNGSGKTTLLDLAAGRRAPLAGQRELCVPAACLDQHLGLLDPGASLLGNVLRLNPQMAPNQARAALARFGFRGAEAERPAGAASGGERLRAALAATLGGLPPPMLLILDEPTNHLDLDGIAALEAALAAYDGAVLAASHDAAFLAALGPDRIVTLPGG